MSAPEDLEKAVEPAGIAPDGEDFLAMELPDGRRLGGLRPLRLFPLSEAEGWIALLDADGAERAIIESLERLGAPARIAVQACLRRHEFLPEIESIIRVSSKLEPSEWTVRTDRGIARFVLRHDSDFRRAGPCGALIVDADGIRYHIADRRKMDARSQRFVEWYIG